jgi:hypothetical protein
MAVTLREQGAPELSFVELDVVASRSIGLRRQVAGKSPQPGPSGWARS